MMRYLYFIMFFLLQIVVLGQDLHLSQFYTNQQMINPALAGDNMGDFQIGVNYRNQWPEINEPLRTIGASLEKRFYNGAQQYQLGLLLLNDQYGPFDVSKTKVALSFGFPIILGKHRITPGIQAGYVMENSDFTSRTHPDQWEYSQGEFNTNLPSGEGNLNDMVQFLDVAAGATYQYNFKRYTNVRLGYALHHFNRPDISKYEDANLPFRHTAHINANLPIGQKFWLMPDAQFSSTTETENLLFGTRMMVKQAGSFYNALYFGAFYRSNLDYEDAIVPVFGFVFKTIDIGVSYDINISELSSLGDQKSTLEISARYYTPMSSPDRFSVPCIRY